MTCLSSIALQPRHIYTDGSIPGPNANVTQEPGVGLSDNFIRAPSAEDCPAVSSAQNLPAASMDLNGIPAVDDLELFPTRYIKQSQSGHNKVAYVVFNGMSPGIFYNW